MASNSVLTLVRNVWPEVTLILERPWQSPQAMAAAIQLLMQSSSCWTQEMLQRVEVIGAPDQLILCLMNDDQIFLCSPRKGSLITHPFVSELRENFHVHFEEYMLDATGDCFTCAASERLKTRLTLPSVLLVNLFHPEMYPTCRLTLGIAYLASYLRLHHLAHVKMIDCQFYMDAEHNIIEHIVEQIQSLRPDILGISVNFGQFDMMELLLKRIYATLAVSPLIILGNILPAMCYREILRVYPEVVICRKEGELSLAALVRYGRDRTHWNQIPGIYYLDADRQKIISTPARYLPLENLPPPALDTVPDLFRHDGVITAEFSRGCQYNQCSFCPRVHKGSIWRTIPVDSMVQQWTIFAHIFQHSGHQAHVFLADEDFVGKELEGDGTLQRLTIFLDRVQHLHISFDASCRADQIFREGRDDAWHIARGRFFRHCKERGLTRLFLGVESGATSQLMRYAKGSSVEEMIAAIRYLSLLGIKLRFGFIFFDPLMSVQDVIDNIEFLGRTDIILPAEAAPVEEIFHFVSSNYQQMLPQLRGIAVYEDVSYMISPLEVLEKSRYHFDLQQKAPQLLNQRLDVSFARYQSNYAIAEIGMICSTCQLWVNYCFPIIYTLKGLQKVSGGDEKALLQSAIVKHRYLSYALIRSLAYALALVDDATMHRWESHHPGVDDGADLHATARYLYQTGSLEKAILVVLNHYVEHVQDLIDQVHTHVHLLSPKKRPLWIKAYEQWRDTPLAGVAHLRTA